MTAWARALLWLCLALPAGGLAQADGAPLERFTQIRLLTDNDEAWQAKRALIASATRSLDLAYFIVEDDASTRVLLQDLVAATQRQRGLRVRLLVDYFMTYRQTAMLQALAAHPGITVRRRGAPSAALREALQAAGIDGARLVAGLTTSDPRLALAALAPSPLFPAQVTAALAALAQQPPQAMGASAMQMLHALAPADAGPWSEAPAVRLIVDELHRFLHWTHHKLLLADGRCFIMGGRNLADAYHRNAPARARAFQDTDVHACDASGPSRAQRSAFDALWAGATDVRAPDAWVMDVPPAAPAGAPEALRADAFTSARAPLPDLDGYLVNNLGAPGGDAAITQAYVERIRERTARGAPGTIDIVNAYLFLSGETPALAALRDSLLAAARAGLTVNIRTNSLASTDLKPVNRVAYQTLGALIAGGIQVYELQPGLGSVHTKAAAIGDDWLLVGSYNLDPRSELYDSNNLLALHDPSGRATAAFRQARVDCDCWTRLTPEAAQARKAETEQGARIWQRVQRLL
ncbi:phosphatidylserine/phosphatidylglycerophosphate/cardiolipin synthase family protein [Pseudorhodoferax sp. Leaf267]|uniref:phospholipase D-like domain-containing protein n=1 Tax=Pseudorhodoferax sp. Leaf267 TaxID=1736316 RepID=UPI0006FF6874|nr:phosphatidylserine/phosphatidylglycerophosphate/cardiolipin synthase family protein [Pseudorhodoferax sp. Leaf267]KQP21787.1 hypothetical protein ASF43_26165 [Pseudorhodoferax sp. Leaf267]